MGTRDVEAPPVGIVHVLLRDLVRLGVHIDGVLGLGPHEVAPDDAALLRHLTYQHYSCRRTSAKFKVLQSRRGRGPHLGPFPRWIRPLSHLRIYKPLESRCETGMQMNLMKALVGTFIQEKALIGAFSVIVKTSRYFQHRKDALPVELSWAMWCASFW